MINHIWFDFAGTLYRETPQFNELHDRFRFDTYAKLRGITDPEIAKREFLAAYKEYGSNSAVFRALGQPSDYWMKALDNMDFKSVLHPDSEISGTVRKLSEKVPVSLFTNFVRYRIDELLGYLEIPSSLFTNILSGDDITERKPALDGFYAMIELSNLPPEEIIYVGDRVDVDIKPAKQLGIKTALVYGESDEANYNFAEFKDMLRMNLEEN